MFSKKQDFLLDMFNMWLVKNGISNLLSVACLERYGFHITYDTYGEWLVTCPDGGVLQFKRDVGVCKGFPYVNLANI